MVFQPGDPKPPTSGRKKGVINKRNAVVNDKIVEMVLNRIDRLGHYMDYMENSGNKHAATNMLLKMAALTMPKGLTFDGIQAQMEAEAETPP